jgi:hypothetical protein
MSDDSELEDDADDIFKIPTTPNVPPPTRVSADMSGLEALKSPLSLSKTEPADTAGTHPALPTSNAVSTLPPYPQESTGRRASIRFKDEEGAPLVQEAETYSPEDYDRSNSDYDIDRNSIDAEIEVHVCSYSSMQPEVNIRFLG